MEYILIKCVIIEIANATSLLGFEMVIFYKSTLLLTN